MALVLDAGILIATLDARDPHHDRCADLFATTNEHLVIPSPVLVEIDQLLETRAGLPAWLAFVDRMTEGGYAIHPVTPWLVVEAARLQQRYADLRLGFVDAAVFLACVELGEKKVATLDRRRFSVLRTEEGRALQILPE